MVSPVTALSAAPVSWPSYTSAVTGYTGSDQETSVQLQKARATGHSSKSTLAVAENDMGYLYACGAAPARPMKAKGGEFDAYVAQQRMRHDLHHGILSKYFLA